MILADRAIGFSSRARHVLLVALVVLVGLAGCGGGGGGGGGGTPATSLAPPAIVTQPQSATVNDGATATFAVAATGTAPLVYQWSRGGVDIAGATGPSYTVPTAQLSDNAMVYAVTVRNAAGSAQSNGATLTVRPVPPSIVNDAATTVSVMEGAAATLQVTTTGSLPMTYQWRRMGAAIAGATSSTYTTPATTAADNGATFDVVVTNAAGTVTSAPFTLAVTAVSQAPTNITLPQFFLARLGNMATFTVTPQGTGPFTYQWFRNGQPIAGAESSSYVINSVQLSDNNASFTVQVTNAAGSVTSSAATLLVLPQPGLALIAGDSGGPGSIDGTLTAARLLQPSSVALDSGGNAFIADGSTVRLVTAAGVVSTLAGSATATGSDDGTGSAATFRDLAGIAVDVASGTIYVADRASHTIRRITSAGVVTTLAGTAGVAGSNDGTGGAANFNGPTGLTVDGIGNIFVADTDNHLIRQVTPAGVVTTIAGTAGVPGSADGTGSGASFNAPRGVIAGPSGFVYVADTGNNTIRSVSTAGAVTTIAGAAGTSGSSDGTGAAARFFAPSGIAVDAAGNVYVSETGNLLVRKIAPPFADVTTIAGSPSVAGPADGTGASAQFASPVGLASDSAGTLFVADLGNTALRRVSTTAVVQTIVGAPALSGSADGNGHAATFNAPAGVAVDAAMNVYVGDLLNATIRRVSPVGDVTTLAGTAGVVGTNDGTGAAAQFAAPRGVAIDAAGNLFVADESSHTIRKVTPDGIVTTFAGMAGVAGSADGSGTAATFDGPSAVAVDAAGNVYVVDANPTVRKITAAGVVTTLAGAAGRFGAVDGPGTSASFGALRGIAVDATGSLFVADAGNATIRKVTATGTVSTVAGLATVPGSADGTGSAARFTSPTGIVVDGSGVLYVADPGTHTIRRIDVDGNVTTVVGVADGLRGVGLGALPGHLDMPIGLAIDRSHNLYTTDANGVIRITLQ